jgi:predicted nucleic acid-binding protein
MTFVDTSAIIGVMNRHDEHHPQARALWDRLLNEGTPLVTTNYVLLEAASLVQRRQGVQALRVLLRDVAPMFVVDWVGPEEHSSAVAAVLAAGRRELGIVDCVSFGVMRRLELTRAFTFDRHFAEQGFEVVP